MYEDNGFMQLCFTLGTQLIRDLKTTDSNPITSFALKASLKLTLFQLTQNLNFLTL